MTNSPPDNVNHGEDRACNLSGGIDSLVVTINLRWKNGTATPFAKLAELKQRAKVAAEDEPTMVSLGADGACMHMAVKRHGISGYEWLLVGSELTISLGNWIEPKQRPSAVVTFRAEALWMYGASAMVELVQRMFRGMGAQVIEMKVSRIDLCADILIPECAWHKDLDEHFVTRAKKDASYRSSRCLSGFTIGSGDVMARIYDKPREIREKSGKHWMFDIWGLPEVPEWHMIVRVEYQLRRTALKQLGIDSWDDVISKLGQLWAYCTDKWLRLVEDPELHHTQQHTLPWWLCVQNGLTDVQPGSPLVRTPAMKADAKQLGAQSIGTLASIIALRMSDEKWAAGSTLDRRSFLRNALDEAVRGAGIDEREFTRRVNRKRAKYQRRPPASGATVGKQPDDSLESREDPTNN